MLIIFVYYNSLNKLTTQHYIYLFYICSYLKYAIDIQLFTTLDGRREKRAIYSEKYNESRYIEGIKCG